MWSMWGDPAFHGRVIDYDRAVRNRISVQLLTLQISMICERPFFPPLAWVRILLNHTPLILLLPTNVETLVIRTCTKSELVFLFALL